MKWKNLQMPKRIQLVEGDPKGRHGRFVIEPIERGFGETLGNALRRVLLSSLQGSAISAVKIEGALHEFTTLPGVLEDTAEIVLNLKQVRLKHHGDGERKGYFKVSGEAEVTAGDMEVPPDIEILNPEQHIATLNREGHLEMEIEIMPGRGYVSADQHLGLDRPIGVIPIDSLFSPVTKVNFEVENTRIGQRIDYDKLTLDIWTNGSIGPQDALSVASRILRDHFEMLINFQEEFLEEREEEVDEEVSRLRAVLNKSVDELELSVRSSNCLRAAKVRTIGDLVQKSEQEMLRQRNFGRKSLKEIEDILSDMGLRFGMDVSDIVASSRVRGEAAAPPVETEEEPLEDVEEVEEEAADDLDVEEEGAADESEAGVTRPAE
jgi:DNA-directed RNA polymerase subunit alpha